MLEAFLDRAGHDMNGQSGDTDHVLNDEIRRRLLKGMGMAAGAMALYPMLSATGAMAASSGSGVSGAQYVYVGTYTGPNTAPGGVAPSRARGIYVFRMDPAQGGLTPVQTMAAETPPFWPCHRIVVTSTASTSSVRMPTANPWDG